MCFDTVAHLARPPGGVYSLFNSEVFFFTHVKKKKKKHLVRCNQRLDRGRVIGVISRRDQEGQGDKTKQQKQEGRRRDRDVTDSSMSGLFRSEEMKYVRLVMYEESARDTMRVLGRDFELLHVVDGAMVDAAMLESDHYRLYKSRSVECQAWCKKLEAFKEVCVEWLRVGVHRGWVYNMSIFDEHKRDITRTHTHTHHFKHLYPLFYSSIPTRFGRR